MTREEAIEILKEIEYPVNGDNRERRDTAFDMAIKALENERPKGKWIPVNERLPEEPICDDGYVEPSDDVLVFGDFGDYGVSRYWGNRRDKSKRPKIYKDWVDLKWITEKPIAWMPLPEPYKAESEKEQ